VVDVAAIVITVRVLKIPASSNPMNSMPAVPPMR
jgi:hypothetical protein